MSKTLPILTTACHSSTFVPKELREMMLLSDEEIIRQSDLYTDEIFHVPNCYFVNGTISRLVADLNRAPDHIEMEHQLANDGVVVSVSEENKPIYKEPPTLKQIITRVEKYHNPFHQKMEYFKEKGAQFIIDGHSMWSNAPAIHHEKTTRPDINIGNRDYSTCNRVITHRIAEFFKSKGLSVGINTPYEGMYVLAAHCSRVGVNGVQIEFNRKLYMDEKTLERKPEAINLFNSYIQELAEIIYQEFLISASH